MPVTVIDRIVPKNNGSFPVVGDEHFLGGFRVVADAAARDAIPSQRRTVGMWVKTLSDSKTWTLVGGTGNANWQAVVFDTLAVGAEVEGDIILAVTTTGNDSDPTRPTRVVSGDWSAKPFATVQAALEALPKVGTNVYAWPGKVLIEVGTGTFPGFFVTGFTYDVYIRGTRSTATPATGPASGTATSGTGKSLTLTGAGWTVNDLVGRFLSVTSGPGAGDAYPILQNTADAIVVSGNVGLAAGSVFTIEDIATLVTDPAPTTYAPVTVYACSASVVVENVATVNYTTLGFSVAYCGSSVTLWHCLAQNKSYGGFSGNGNLQVWMMNCIALDSAEGFAFQADNLAAVYVCAAVYCDTGFSFFLGITWAYAPSCAARNCDTGMWAEAVADCTWYDLTLDNNITAIYAERARLELSAIEIKNTTSRTFRLRLAQASIGALSGSGNAGFGLNVNGVGNVIELTAIPTIAGASGDATVDGVAAIPWTDLDAVGDYAVNAVTGSRVVKV